MAGREKPLLFVMPGSHGDDSGLREFREMVSPDGRAVIVEHRRHDAGRDLATVGRSTADRIEAEIAEGPIHLCGYSYGACLAQETARQLVTRGRDVAFVALLDPPLPGTDYDLGSGEPASVGRSRMREAHPVDWILRIPGLLAAVEATLPQGVARRAMRWSSTRLRRATVRTWRPHPLESRGFVLVTTQFAPAVTDDLLRLCPGMPHVTLDCRHAMILSRTNRADVAKLVRERFEAASARWTGETDEIVG